MRWAVKEIIMSSKVLTLKNTNQIVSSTVFWNVHDKFRESIDKHSFYKHKYILDVTPWLIWTETQWNNDSPQRHTVYGWVPYVYGALIQMTPSFVRIPVCWAVHKVENSDTPVTVVGFGPCAVILFGSRMKDFRVLLLNNDGDFELFKADRARLVSFIQTNNVKIEDI